MTKYQLEKENINLIRENNKIKDDNQKLREENQRLRDKERLVSFDLEHEKMMKDAKIEELRKKIARMDKISKSWIYKLLE